MKKITLLKSLFVVLALSLFSFSAAAQVTATWSIEEGATVRSFSSVNVTFSGVDSVGRKLDGTECTKVMYQGAATNVMFYSVAEDGTLTPVQGGKMTASTTGMTLTYKLTEDKGYTLVDGTYAVPGKYRIVIDNDVNDATKVGVGDLLFMPNRTGLPKVYNDQTYVLNFTIDANYVEKTAVEANFQANYANGTVVDTLREVILTFPQYDSIFINPTTLAGHNYVTVDTLAVIPGDEELGTPAQTLWNPIAPMQWSVVEGQKNAIRIFIPTEMFPQGYVTGLGNARIVVPAGVMTFTKTEAAETYNKEFTLNYFVGKGFMLTTGVNDPAKGSIDVVSGAYAAGATVTLTATPAEGYKLLAWSDRSTENTLTVTMDTNKVVTAYFVKDYEFAPRFTIEKVWEYGTLPATADGYQAVGRDGVIYVQNKTAAKIQTITAEGFADYATESGAGQQIAMDNAGNIIIFNATFYSANPNAIKVFQNGSTTAKDLTFTLPYAGRCDFLTASGDIFSAEGGYVYFYCQTQTYINRVQIANGEVVAVDAVGGDFVAGNSQNNVMLDIFGNMVAHSRSNGVKSYNFTTGASAAFTLPSFKMSTLGGCSFELGGRELWAYNVGTTNYNSEWNLYNYTDGKLLSDTAMYAKDDFSINSAANWLTVQVIEDTAYIYQFCPAVAAAVWKVTFTTDPIEVSTMDELKAHEGELVLYKGLEPAKVTMGEGRMSYTEYFMPDSTTALNYSGYILPAKMDVYGTYYTEYAADAWSDTVPTFVVSKVEAIHTFYNMNDLVNFVENEATDEQKMASYEVKETALVTLAGPMSFYIQYEAQSMHGAGSSWKGLAAQTGRMTMLQFMPKAGDEITLKGSYNAPMYDDEYNMLQPGFFAVENATLVSENNKLHYTPFNLADGGLQYASEYYASLVRLSKGGKIVEDDMGIYYEFDFLAYVENPETGMYEEVSAKDSLVLMVAGPVDLEQYIGKELDMLLAGVLDYDAYSQTPILYVSELQESKLYYNTIAELIAAGAQNEYSMPSVLRNPVLLTYISYNLFGGYTIFVQDSTGAIAVQGLGVANEDGEYTAPFPYDVVPGDSITGIEGFTTLEAAAFMWSGADYNVDLNLTKVAEGTIEPIDITLADFNADVELVQEAIMMGEFYLSEYANKVVRVQGLTRVDDPEDEKWPWLRQGEDSIKVSTYYWGEIAVADSIVSLTGIADYTIINRQTASIQPLNAESVVVPVIDNVEYVTLTDLYTENGLIVTEGEFQIFTVTGQNVTNMNGRLTSGVYVVRTATAVGKVIIK